MKHEEVKRMLTEGCYNCRHVDYSKTESDLWCHVYNCLTDYIGICEAYERSDKK
jgi:hypothetical protein